ncbi:hypothetical protein TSAR_011584 [Trichomalopsis sarcophagae]|uniref:Pre-C2HC domain-containing protein n=1 Tax=Trichomalopsis sarcophagae TaxID=543379 RepID=A0A232EGS8_9HYME|nr:hypothetical protein TSAR_011584 [Trichomalopsis sarcophagae]
MGRYEFKKKSPFLFYLLNKAVNPDHQRKIIASLVSAFDPCTSCHVASLAFEHSSKAIKQPLSGLTPASILSEHQTAPLSPTSQWPLLKSNFWNCKDLNTSTWPSPSAGRSADVPRMGERHDTVTQQSSSSNSDDLNKVIFDLQVIRGVNESYSEEEILEEIRCKHPAVKKVFRMRKGEKVWPLVIVQLDLFFAHAKTIFDLKMVGGLKVTVEPKRKSKFTLLKESIKFYKQMTIGVNRNQPVDYFKRVPLTVRVVRNLVTQLKTH